jgi:glucose-induced degradation protein 8
MIRSSFSSDTSKTDSNAVSNAIQFAQKNLAPYATMPGSFKNDLERAMALLIVPRESWAPAQQSRSSTSHNDFGALSELVDPSLRQRVAKDVNEAILASQGQNREAKIRHLVRTRAWAEQLARDRKVDLPNRLNLGLDGEEPSSSHSDGDTEMSGNSAENGGASAAESRARSRPTSGITDAMMMGYSNINQQS